MNTLSWASNWGWGKYKPKSPEELAALSEEERKKYKPATLLSVMVADKSWLRWCYEQGLYAKYNELEFIRENVKPREWDAILNAKGNN